MPRVIFTEQAQYNLAQQLLTQASSLPAIQRHPEQRAIDIKDARIARLFERLNTPLPVILPYFHSSQDYWLIAGQQSHTLDQVRTRITRFLHPSYGCFSNNRTTPQPFDPTVSSLQAIAAQLFAAGYYRWQSATKYRSRILERLMLWLELEAQQPTVTQTITQTYQQLINAFETALHTKAWNIAQQCITEMQRRHMSTAENLIFLRVQLLASQEKWQDIWQHEDYPIWAQLSMPRSVRTALLVAFHICELFPLEQMSRWQDALSTFKAQRPQLGMLLTGPFEQEKAPIVRILAYQAVADGDQQRLVHLQMQELDSDTQRCLSALSKLMPVPSTPPSTSSPLQQILIAFSIRDFAVAEGLIKEVNNVGERTLLLLELAFHSKDDKIRERAWHSYQALTFNEQETLRTHERFVERYLSYIQDFKLPLDADLTQTKPTLVTQETTWPTDTATARDLAWKGICAVESELRQIVAQRYKDQFGDNWESRLSSNPEDVEKWKQLREKDERAFSGYEQPLPSLLDYTYLDDLLAMINRQWQLFMDIFGTGKPAKQELRRKLEAIIRVRNPLAHNRVIPTNEIKRADVYSEDLLRLLKG